MGYPTVNTKFPGASSFLTPMIILNLHTIGFHFLLNVDFKPLSIESKLIFYMGSLFIIWSKLSRIGHLCSAGHFSTTIALKTNPLILLGCCSNSNLEMLR